MSVINIKTGNQIRLDTAERYILRKLKKVKDFKSPLYKYDLKKKRFICKTNLKKGGRKIIKRSNRLYI